MIRMPRGVCPIVRPVSPDPLRTTEHHVFAFVLKNYVLPRGNHVVMFFGSKPVCYSGQWIVQYILQLRTV